MLGKQGDSRQQIRKLIQSLTSRFAYMTKQFDGMNAELSRLRGMQSDAALATLHEQVETSRTRLQDAQGGLLTLRRLMHEGQLDEAEKVSQTMGTAIDAEKAELLEYRRALAQAWERARQLELSFSGDTGGGMYHSMSLEGAMLKACGFVMIRDQVPLLGAQVERLDAELTQLKAIYSNPPYDASNLLARVAALAEQIRELQNESDRLRYKK